MTQNLENLKDQCAWVLKTAKDKGANDCRVSINQSRFVDIEYRKRKPETVKEASKKVLNIEIYVNQRYSYQSTSDLRKVTLEKFIENAVTTTKLLAEDPFRSLTDPKYYQNRPQVDLKNQDPEYNKISPEKRHALVRHIENVCLARGSANMISVSASEYDSFNESATLATNGFEGSKSSTFFWAGAEMTLQDQGNRRPNGYHSISSVMNKDIFTQAEPIGHDTVKRARDLLGGVKIDTETLPIIVENRIVPELLYGFVTALSGRFIQQKRSFLGDKKNQLIGSKHFTLIDDPLLPGGHGSRLYDSDGISAKKHTLVEAGVLKNFYVDWYYGQKLGSEPTSGDSSNLLVPPGKRSLAEIMQDLKRGILVTDFMGGNSNSTTGDFSIGILGKLFDQGEIVQSVAEMNIAGNHLTFWKNLVEVANDPWPYSSWRTPSLICSDVVVSGA